jgi:uncharacterized membrane protein YbhN (UPF0104 family)
MEPESDTNATPTDGSGEAPPAELPNRRTAILRTALLLGVLFFVFGIVLPRFVDYEEVFSALAALTPPEIALISVIGIIAWFCCGQVFTVLLSGLSPLRGMTAYLILSGMGPSLPFGPWNLGVVWVVIRGWGHSIHEATSSVALYGIVNTLARFAMPLIALVAVVASGQLGRFGNATTIIAAVSIVIFFVATGFMISVVRSDRAADWLGRTIQRAASWILGRLGRSETPDLDASIHRFRDSLGEIVHERGLLALVVTIAAQIPWMVCFIVALRLTGVPADVVAPADVIAVFSLVSVITIIPIAPGGAGVPELLYIAGLTAIAGPEYNAAITAGVFLFRLYVWFLPIPIAWILLKIVRRGRPMLPTTIELRSYAAAGQT